MSFVIPFSDPRAVNRELTGGKGANLAILTRAGFNIPGGFCVTTEAYSAFLERDRAGARLNQLVSKLDYDAAALEEQTLEIRKLLEAGEMPDSIRAEVMREYAKLGSKAFVAVRSSGTAEDLAEASFAGMHDTYLDVKGEEQLMQAIKRCWASMWTSRAAAYRKNNAFEHLQAKICVVVQTMVSAEVSGVMFTGNPLNGANNEAVINASWGLGEAIVSGITNPDTYIVWYSANMLFREKLVYKERLLGSKEVQVRRADADAGGTVREETSQGQRTAYCLSDEQVRELIRLGIRIQDHYEGFPQDIEWALFKGELYLLQSRPVTGVEFSWDCDLEAGFDGFGKYVLEENPHDLYSRGFADDLSNGVNSPLNYSLRSGGTWGAYAWPRMMEMLGLPEAAKKRAFKFRKGKYYYNLDFDRALVELLYPPSLRAKRCGEWYPEALRKEVVAAPFSWTRWFKAIHRLHFTDVRSSWKGFFWDTEDWRKNRQADCMGLATEQLRKLTDKELILYCERQTQYEGDWDYPMGGIAAEWMIGAMLLLDWMCSNWYDGPAADAYIRLIGGSKRKTDTQIENEAINALAEEIRASPELSRIFEENAGVTFFEALAQSDLGRRFLAKYREFAERYPHRGESERDVYHPRREDDPLCDLRTFSMILASPPANHEKREVEVNSRREETYNEVVSNLKAKPLGFLKAEAFKIIHNLVLEFNIVRDNERQDPHDKIVMAYWRGYREIGHRLAARGLLEDHMDVVYLSRWENYALLRGEERNMRLVNAKIEARRRDLKRVENHEADLPKFIRGNEPVVFTDTNGESGGLKGFGVAPGSTVGTARVVLSLKEVGRVNKGEILIVHATDPGWTSVFLLVKGVVAETGGLLGHAACLCREYGFPAVQLAGATKTIPDGATIEVNGSTGQVTILGDHASIAA